MGNPAHLSIIKQGVEVWNKWRDANQKLNPDLKKVDLHGSKLQGIDLSNSSLQNANLKDSDFSNANFSKAVLSRADLSGSKMSGANFSDADLGWTNLISTEMKSVLLTGAQLNCATMFATDFTNAVLNRCNVFGMSAWKIIFDNTTQSDILIKNCKKWEAALTVDSVEIAQLLILLLSSQKFCQLYDTINSRIVVIFGRFGFERKIILEALRDELRKQNYMPVLFSIEKPSGKDRDSLIKILIQNSRFIIADLTDPDSIPNELLKIIPFIETTPFAPIILQGTLKCRMLENLEGTYRWVMPKYEYNYKDAQNFAALVSDKIILPCQEKVKVLISDMAYSKHSNWVNKIDFSHPGY